MTMIVLTENKQRNVTQSSLSSTAPKTDNDTAIETIKPSLLQNNTLVSRSLHYPDFVRDNVNAEIVKHVLRQKLAKRRHLVLKEVIDPAYLEGLFPQMLELFNPQTVQYNGGIANIQEWKISCYLEVMPGGIPTTNPNTQLLELFEPLLEACNDLFWHWYKQQHACNKKSNHFENKLEQQPKPCCRRLMTFITRYTPQPGEQALLKHIDGAGKVDGSIVVALPIDRWSASYEDNIFEGGGLTFWDGGSSDNLQKEQHYDTRSGDVAFIDRAVWHQADPITKGVRWALVIFYKVE